MSADDRLPRILVIDDSRMVRASIVKHIRGRFEAREDRSQDWNAWSADLARKKSIPLGRLGQPDDLASAIAFFGSDDAGFITGQVISVSGGLTMHG